LLAVQSLVEQHLFSGFPVEFAASLYALIGRSSQWDHKRFKNQPNLYANVSILAGQYIDRQMPGQQALPLDSPPYQSQLRPAPPFKQCAQGFVPDCQHALFVSDLSQSLDPFVLMTQSLRVQTEFLNLLRQWLSSYAGMAPVCPQARE
jgi:hypothetical protein